MTHILIFFFFLVEFNNLGFKLFFDPVEISQAVVEKTSVSPWPVHGKKSVEVKKRTTLSERQYLSLFSGRT